MSYSKQRDRLLMHLRDVGPITAAEAMRIYGIGRCAARVKDLREAGFKVITTTITVRTRHGIARVASYSLGVKRGK